MQSCCGSGLETSGRHQVCSGLAPPGVAAWRSVAGTGPGALPGASPQRGPSTLFSAEPAASDGHV